MWEVDTLNLLQLTFLTTKEAIVGVALPVALLLFAVAYIEAAGYLNFERLFARARALQPVLGAVTSAVPGCAGSITLTRLYGLGAVSAGTLYAAHVATLGDAAFVLWSRRPLETLGLTAIVAATGTVVGYVVQSSAVGRLLRPDDATFSCPVPGRLPLWASALWLFLLLQGLIAALLMPTQAALSGGIALGLVAFGVVILRLPPAPSPRSPLARALQSSMRDAAEIVAWVVVADVLFQLANAVSHGVLVRMLHGDVLADVLLATAVGLIPGCGPQIVVATLFVSGDLPFAALLANTLSQHGDAIFPLLKAQRRLAAYLTLAGGVVGAVVGLMWAGIVP